MAVWLRIRIHPNFVGPASIGTVAPIQVLREELALTLPAAKSLIDRAVFDAEVVRVPVESESRAELVSRKLND